MSMRTRKVLATVTRYLILVFCLYLLSWLLLIGEKSERRRISRTPVSTMRTIIAYSDKKLAELERPEPVSCDFIPQMPEVPFINRTWAGNRNQQPLWQPVAGTDVMLYSAYYDTRNNLPYIRILAMFTGHKYVEPQLYCQTRLPDGKGMDVEVVTARPLEIWSEHWDADASKVETPLLLSCGMTGHLVKPIIVSVVTDPCEDPTNAFKLEPIKQKQDRRNFTICVKDMNFEENFSSRLIEWIEVNRILGAEMIDIYVESICTDMQVILQEYHRKGLVRLFEVPVIKNARPLWQRRRDHIVSYNDCLYRNVKESKFIIPLDIDEVILPKKVDNWHKFVETIDHLWNSTVFSAVLVKNVFFFDFMQSSGLNRSNQQNASTNKVYAKADDVRLKKSLYNSEMTQNKINNVSNVKLILYNIFYHNSLIKKTDKRTRHKYYQSEYKKRCKRDMIRSRVVEHTLRSSLVSPDGHYTKSFMLTSKVITAFNHYPLASFSYKQVGGWPAPFDEIQVNHYKESCNATIVGEDCSKYGNQTVEDMNALKLQDKLLDALSKSPCVTGKDSYNGIKYPS